MGRQSILLAAIVGVVIFSSSTYARNQSNSYTNDKYGFTIQFPNGWTIKDGVAPGTIVNAVHRDDSGRVTMISINTQGLAEGEDRRFRNTSPEEIFQVIKRQFIGQGIEMTLLDSGVTSINGEYAIWHKHRSRKPGGMDKTFLTYNIPRKGNLLVVGGCADPEIYPKAESIVKEAIATLQFNHYDTSPNFQTSLRRETWVTSFLIAFGKVFLFALGMSAIVGVGKYVLTKVKKQK